MANPDTKNTAHNGAAPVDPTNIAPDVDAGRMQEGAEAAAEAAGQEGARQSGPIGGDATEAATSWSGDKDA